MTFLSHILSFSHSIATAMQFKKVFIWNKNLYFSLQFNKFKPPRFDILMAIDLIEALNQFRKSEPGISIQHDKSIIGFRNRLIHAYDSLDNSIVWAILNRHLRPLKAEVLALTNIP